MFHNAMLLATCVTRELRKDETIIVKYSSLLKQLSLVFQEMIVKLRSFCRRSSLNV